MAASKRRRGGANPVVSLVTIPVEEGADPLEPAAEAAVGSSLEPEVAAMATDVEPIASKPVSVVDYKFFHNSAPLRFVGAGKYSFQPYFLGTAATPKVKPFCCPKGHTVQPYHSYK